MVILYKALPLLYIFMLFEAADIFFSLTKHSVFSLNTKKSINVCVCVCVCVRVVVCACLSSRLCMSDYETDPF